MNNLVLIFSTVQINRNLVKQRIRSKSYRISIDSILRWTPENSGVYLIDNSNFFKTKSGKKFLQDLSPITGVLSMSENLGKSNKGLGELSMLEYATHCLDFSKFDRVFLFTGRHFLTNPYLIDKIIESDFDIAIGKPLFHQLDGSSEQDGDVKSYNDMFYAMNQKILTEYISYFHLNRNRMVKGQIGSEQLLYEFVEKHRLENPNVSIYVAPALGILRYSRKSWGSLDRLEIL
jgi:hypothetical protein